MPFWVRGSDRASGEPAEFFSNAETAESARAEASLQGIEVHIVDSNVAEVEQPMKAVVLPLLMFLVRGHVRQTGDPAEFFMNAGTAEMARAEATAQGIEVQTVERYTEPPEPVIRQGSPEGSLFSRICLAAGQFVSAIACVAWTWPPLCLWRVRNSAFRSSALRISLPVGFRLFCAS